MVSLGQGQGPIAVRHIEEATCTGDWVFLQNCHLASSFMAELERRIEGFNAAGSKVSAEFRLWLSTMPCTHFPISVLQNGIKVTTESPRGLRSNMLKSLTEISPTLLQQATKPHEFRKLLFGLVLFHSIVQERKNFGALGWNIKYEFNDADLHVSLEMLRMYLDESAEGVPWDTLLYMISEISYGGRVTDKMDRRCIGTIIAVYFTPAALHDGHKFSSSGVYCSPPGCGLEDYRAYVEGLPLQSEPETFGMHSNASISYQLQESSYLLDTVASIQPREGLATGAGRGPDEVVAALTEDLVANLPQCLSADDPEQPIYGAQFEVGADGLMHSMATVLLHEMGRFNKLLKEMRASLLELEKALRGMVVMSDELEGVFDAMLAQHVPQSWARVAYPSLKPLSAWVKDLYSRVNAVRLWLQEGPPLAFWLSGLFFPQGFMTAVLQTHARKHSMAIDTLSFMYRIHNTDYTGLKERPADGVVMYGLFTDGAAFDWSTCSLIDSSPGQMHTAMPSIHFLPAVNYVPSKKDYEAPLYKTSLRAGTLSTTGHSTNFVISISLPSARDPSYWVLRGAALLCQLNE